MKKRIFLIHGWDGHPEEGWRPWLKKELENRDWEVIVPSMPDTATPTLEKWLPYLSEKVENPDENCYFVGHSLGCITILKYLETLRKNQKVGGSIFVAGFSYDLEYDSYKKELASFFKKSLDWKKIKKHCNKFVAIHSSDDPWVNIEHLSTFSDKLGAEVVRMDGMKHFSGDDGINKLPIVLNKLLIMSV